MSFLQTTKRLHGSTNFNNFIPPNCAHLPIERVGFRRSIDFDTGYFHPLKVQSKALKWKGSPREKAIEATTWFIDSAFYEPLAHMKHLIPDQRVKVQVGKEIFEDLDRLEKIAKDNFPYHTPKSILSKMEEERYFVEGKLCKHLHVFEVPKRAKPHISSLESMGNFDGPIKMRVLFRITGVYCPREDQTAKMCMTVDQIHWRRGVPFPSMKRRGNKRVLGVLPINPFTEIAPFEEPANKRNNDRVSHFNEDSFKDIIKDFTEDWIETKQLELNVRWERVHDDFDVEMSEKDDVDLFMTDKYIQELLGITQTIYKEPDLVAFLKGSGGFYDYAQDLHNQQYQTQPFDHTLMKLQQIKLDYHRDLLEFVHRTVLGLRLHQLRGVDEKSQTFATLKDEVEGQIKPVSEDDASYLGATQTRRLEYLSHCLKLWLENALSERPIRDSFDVIKDVEVPQTWIAMMRLLIDLFDRQVKYDIAMLLVDGYKTRIQTEPLGPGALFKLWMEVYDYWAGTYTEGHEVTGPASGVYDQRLRIPLRGVMQLVTTNLSLNNGGEANGEYLGKIQNTLDCFFERVPMSKNDFLRQDIVSMF